MLFKRVEPFPGEVYGLYANRLREVSDHGRTRVEFDLAKPTRHSAMVVGLLLGLFMGVMAWLVVGQFFGPRAGVTLGVLVGVFLGGGLPSLLRNSQARMARPIIEFDASAKTLLLWQMERPRDLTRLDRLVLRMRRGERARTEQSLGVSVHAVARGDGRELWVHSIVCTRGQTIELVDHIHRLCSPILPVVVESLVENLRHPLESASAPSVDGGT